MTGNTVAKLNLKPSPGGYGFQDPSEVIAIELDGGPSRLRRDQLNSRSQVDVQWVLDREGFLYLQEFYRTTTQFGSLSFQIDLVTDYAENVEHSVYFVPGTLRLQEKDGHRYIVTASLEVTQMTIDEAEEANRVYLFTELGRDYPTLFPLVESQLDVMMNQIIPGDL